MAVASLLSASMDPTPRLSIQDAINACDDRSARVLDRVFEYQSDRVRRGELDELLLQHWLERGLEHAAHGGLTAVVQRIVSHHHPRAPLRATIDAAARRGHLQILQWLYNHDADRVTPLLRAAVLDATSNGHIAILQWLSDGMIVQLPWHDCLATAVEHGHTAIAQWIDTSQGYQQQQSLGEPPPAQLLSLALSSGSLEMVQWLCARHASATCDDALALAVRSRQLELVQFVLRAERFQHCPISADDVAAASRAGDVSIVECLVERSGLPVPRDLLQNLFRRPLNMDVLVAALRRHSALWRVDNGICLDGACRWRRLDVLQAIEAIVGSKATFTTRSVLVAAENGDLEMLQWLERRVPWPWDAPVVEVAAGSGNVKLMQWLQTRSSGVECTSSAMDNAAGGGHLAAVQWLHVNRQGEGCTTDAMDSAAAIGALDVVRWLHEHRTEGCTTSAMDEAAANGHLGVVQFLHAHRSEGCTTSAMDMAAANGHLEVVVWLHNHRREGCTPAAIEDAVTGGFAAVVAWLAQGRVHQDAIAESLKRAEARGLEDIANVLRQAMGTEVTDTERPSMLA
ncbi:hypothetical protein ATCC90586_006837 [Pythium insidiosum]|nr:hypothetical protein ATCC90586_006837 [Pythium insidiosum]